jgi:hypothetical protein
MFDSGRVLKTQAGMLDRKCLPSFLGCKTRGCLSDHPWTACGTCRSVMAEFIGGGSSASSLKRALPDFARKAPAMRRMHFYILNRMNIDASEHISRDIHDLDAYSFDISGRYGQLDWKEI